MTITTRPSQIVLSVTRAQAELLIERATLPPEKWAHCPRRTLYSLAERGLMYYVPHDGDVLTSAGASLARALLDMRILG